MHHVQVKAFTKRIESNHALNVRPIRDFLCIVLFWKSAGDSEKERKRKEKNIFCSLADIDFSFIENGLKSRVQNEKKTDFILPSKIHQNYLKRSVLLTDKLPQNPGEMMKVFQQNFGEL